MVTFFAGAEGGSRLTLSPAPPQCNLFFFREEFYFYLFWGPCHVAHRIKPTPPAVQKWSLNQRTTREVHNPISFNLSAHLLSGDGNSRSLPGVIKTRAKKKKKDKSIQCVLGVPRSSRWWSVDTSWDNYCTNISWASTQYKPLWETLLQTHPT